VKSVQAWQLYESASANRNDKSKGGWWVGVSGLLDAQVSQLQIANCMPYIPIETNERKTKVPMPHGHIQVHVANGFLSISPFPKKSASGKEAPNTVLRKTMHLQPSPFGRRTSVPRNRIEANTLYYYPR